MMASADYIDPAQAAPTGTGWVTLYTVASGKRLVASTLTVAFIGASGSVTYDIAVRPAAATLANKHYVAKNVTLRYGETDTLTLGITASATTAIDVKTSSAESVAFNLFGTVITP
jgi:hypothetical protein